MQILVRPEVPADFQAVSEIHRLAFGGDIEAQLVAALRREPGRLPELSLIALAGDAVVGHIIFSVATIRGASSAWPALALGPIAVLPVHQRGGVGSMLMRAGLEACRRLGHARVLVLGHPEYYPRFGFSAASAWSIRAPFDVPDEAFMAIALTPGALDGCAGMLEYASPFNDL